MMPAGFLILLFITGGENSNAADASEREFPEPPTYNSENLTDTDGVFSDRVCSYHDIVEYLNLTRRKEEFTWTRPVLHHKNPTVIYLDVALYALLDVVEKTQTFIPYIWIYMFWKNERISWDPSEFCGIDRISIPNEMVWKPDLTIHEMIESDKAPPTPFLYVFSSGDIFHKNDQVVVSTCNMNVDKFPFDTQRCNITFTSMIHDAREIQLRPYTNSTLVTEWSREVMHTQDEWEFLGMDVRRINFTDLYRQEKIIYTITIRRRPILYIVNFMVPVLFFMCLDLASFFIPDNGGEKLGFKVTVLLAITVLQLILHEIMPSTSNSIPLIVTYCIGIFGLMLLSLLETVFVTYLMEKDSLPREREADRGSLREDCEDKQDQNNCYIEKSWNACTCIQDTPGVDTPCALHPVAEEVSKSTEADGLHLILGEVKKIQALFLRSQKEEGKPGYWTRVARRIDNAFLVFYITIVLLFFFLIFMKWSS